MSHFLNIFTFCLLWNIYCRFAVSCAEPPIVQSKNEFHYFNDQCDCFQQQHIDHLKEQIGLLKERVDFLSMKLLSHNIDSQTINTQQTNFTELLIASKLQVLKSQEAIRNELLADNRKLLKSVEEMLSNVKEKRGHSSNCVNATRLTHKSDIYEIVEPQFDAKPFAVYCDNEIDNGGWLVIQRRVDGSVDFNRNWTDYKVGFGDLRGDFFIGLDKLHALTTVGVKQELYILMQSVSGATKYAKYSSFAIGNESEDYYLKELGIYSGNATDSMRYHVTRKFSTIDRDNYPDTWKPCPATYKAGWWFGNCYHVLLNGLYTPSDDTGMQWHKFEGDWTNLKFVQMMIRPAH